MFRIQYKNFTEEQAYRRIKDGWSIFREYWCKQEPDENHQLFGGRDVDQIKDYCELVQLLCLEKDQLESINELLFQTSNNSFLDLLMSEVDYYWFYKNKPDEIDFLNDVREIVAEKLDSWFEDKKKDVDEKLLFCKNQEDLTRILADILKQEIEGQPVFVKTFFSKNYDVFKSINRRIGRISELDNCKALKEELQKLSSDIENYSESNSWFFHNSSNLE